LRLRPKAGLNNITFFQETIFEADDLENSASSSNEAKESNRRRRKCFTEAAGNLSKAPRRIDTKYWIQVSCFFFFFALP
jgi:hypothetical protein